MCVFWKDMGEEYTRFASSGGDTWRVGGGAGGGWGLNRGGLQQRMMAKQPYPLGEVTSVAWRSTAIVGDLQAPRGGWRN